MYQSRRVTFSPCHRSDIKQAISPLYRKRRPLTSKTNLRNNCFQEANTAVNENGQMSEKTISRRLKLPAICLSCYKAFLSISNVMKLQTATRIIIYFIYQMRNWHFDSIINQNVSRRNTLENWVQRLW